MIPAQEGVKLKEELKIPEIDFDSFMKSIDTTAIIMDSLQFSRGEWMIISGGAVALHQYYNGFTERLPTDMDVVIWHENGTNNGLDRLNIVGSAFNERQPGSAKVLTETRTHHDYIFHNPILEVDIPQHMPIDILAAMTTEFPQNAPIPILAGVSHRFPTDNWEIYEATRSVQTPSGEIHIANPAFIAFYKLTMMRNQLGKQDTQDMRRLRRMGLFDNLEEIQEQIKLLSNGSESLTRYLLTEIYSSKYE